VTTLLRLYLFFKKIRCLAFLASLPHFATFWCLFFFLFKYVTASCSLLVSFRCFPLRHVIKFIDGLLFQFQTKTEFQETVTAFIEISSIWSLGLLFISVFDWLIFLWFAGQPALSILTCIRSRFFVFRPRRRFPHRSHLPSLFLLFLCEYNKLSELQMFVSELLAPIFALVSGLGAAGTYGSPIGERSRFF